MNRVMREPRMSTPTGLSATFWDRAVGAGGGGSATEELAATYARG
jgi:hypothetical protein